MRSCHRCLGIVLVAFVFPRAARAAEPPYPGPGQTVHWTAAMNPIDVVGAKSIVAGGTVIVDPGAQIQVQGSLTVSGSFFVQGDAANPVQIAGAVGSFIAGSGTETYSHAIIDTRVDGEAFSDCVFGPAAVLGVWSFAIVPSDHVTTVQRSVFNGSRMFVRGQTLLEDLEFFAAPPGLNPVVMGYAVVRNVTVHGMRMEFNTADGQAMFLDELSVTGNAGGPGLRLDGGRDYLIGDKVILQGNDVPIDLGSRHAGLLPGSVVPETGNANNYILDAIATDPKTSVRWAALPIPYVVPTGGFAGGLTIDPGATVRFGPGASWTFSSSRFEPKGLPWAPIRFERLSPSQAWGGLIGFERLEWCEVVGATANSADGPATYITNSTLSQNQTAVAVGTLEAVYTRSSRFFDNGTAIGLGSTTAAAGLSSAGDPNHFEGNAAAVDNGSVATVPAAWNYWGDPSGPKHPSNPGGQGDAITGNAGAVKVKPFLTAPPATANTPPVVRAKRPLFDRLDPHTDFVLEWDVTDDDVVSQRVSIAEFTNHPGDFSVLAGNLGPDRRSVQFTVPKPATQNPIYLRVSAFDSAGHEGFDDVLVYVPQFAAGTGQVSITTDLSGPFTIGQTIGQICFQFQGSGGFPSQAYLLLEADDVRIPLGANGSASNPCTILDVTLPDYSTDLARIAFVSANGDADWYFSDSFSIRPDPRLGDAPPSISVTSPAPGATFVAGSVVPVAWTAGDDEGLRSFGIQASYDGGRRWTWVEEELPGASASFGWHPPAGPGLNDVRIRVIARDRRFQNSSDTVAFSVSSGGSVCQTDLGFGGPGDAKLSMCGDPLATGGVSDLLVTGALPNTVAWLIASTSFQPQPFLGGTLVPLPPAIATPVPTGASGIVAIPGVPGGGGPLDVYAQFVILDPAQPAGAAISNAVRIAFLP